jgi:hypothetical protein
MSFRGFKPFSASATHDGQDAILRVVYRGDNVTMRWFV